MFCSRTLLLALAFTLAHSIDVAAQEGLVELRFSGTYRKTSKTSMVRMNSGSVAPYQTYSTLRKLMATFPSDESMRQKYPAISDVEPEMMRTPEELRNVQVVAYIYAAKLESDNDFHIILGTSPDSSKAKFLNTEISGLPDTPGANFDSIRACRQQFLSLFPDARFTTGSYTRLGRKKVRVRGATIFDADHHPGCAKCPGPKFAKPKTVWEIHPIVWIELIGGGSADAGSPHQLPLREGGPR